jgi:hypothetical protein
MQRGIARFLKQLQAWGVRHEGKATNSFPQCVKRVFIDIIAWRERGELTLCFREVLCAQKQRRESPGLREHPKLVAAFTIRQLQLLQQRLHILHHAMTPSIRFAHC